MSQDPLKAYAEAGVDVAAGDRLVDRITPAAAATQRAGALPALGGFGAAFDLGAAGHEGSLLIASTDGVGTKLRLATDLGRHEGIGIDLVAMCVNDILAQGAEPLFFLDYYATGALDVAAAATVVESIAAGCKDAGCALIGGETAEMPGHYAKGDYDLAGFSVGAVKRDEVLPRDTLAEGDVLIGLASSGAHSNGYSLIRKLAADNGWDMAAPFEGGTLGEALLAPTRIYVRPVLAALKSHGASIKAVAHITGGGLTGNIPRILPDGLAAKIDRRALPANPVMAFLQKSASLSDATMEATFNCGVGLVIAVAEADAAAIALTLQDEGEWPAIIGTLIGCEDGAERCQIG
ncbi:phosphoribosylformylglycinamidine cyclo-ligase [Acuticoccus sp. MNP-M23]|uniref:phosphoribosylformylglycinamidine cyclo-ligase n=1 Tax=Acuticoccus sp. MNP-M23 TaxID=3072793 RepID=UPI002816144B|nr:phosphoribosylformylglycinamidine cyclo-ligase [Acuticoccus sp. MNP-M23]WMS41666.1 phosphoribosylformylglycinamidine cyclo-ligase [Acuticoccus sp. MNP-M23]